MSWDSKGRKSFGRVQGGWVKGGNQRAADGRSGYERHNGFTVRCNFARQNCIKDSLLNPSGKSTGCDRLHKFRIFET